MTSLVDLMRQFHQIAIAENIPQSHRAMYYYLLGEYNALRRPHKFSTTRMEIMAKSGCRCRQTMYSSLKFLKENGFINFNNNASKTRVFVEMLDVTEWRRNVISDDNKLASSITHAEAPDKNIKSNKKSAHEPIVQPDCLSAENRRSGKSFDEILREIQERRNSGNM